MQNTRSDENANQAGQKIPTVYQRMGARVRAHEVDHAPIVTAPAMVVDIIREAIAEVRKS